jgi:fructose-bisphosphate aldolase class 1
MKARRPAQTVCRAWDPADRGGSAGLSRIDQTPGLGECVSGVILYDETIRQRKKDGTPFLSGGQPAKLASARLNAMNVRFKSRLPWALAFSFARAIQRPALEIWRGEGAHVLAAQQALSHRARCNQTARRGEYDAAMDTDMSATTGIPQFTTPAGA